MPIVMPTRDEQTGEESRKTLYEGCVLDDRERNFYDDSDFYAVVWDEDERSIKQYQYNTTRFAGGGSCRIDATDEVRRKADDWLVEWALPILRKMEHDKARTVEKDKRVRVFKGRKAPIGTEGKVFWLQHQNGDPYGRSHGWRTKIGIAVDDETEAVEKVGRCGTPYTVERYRNVVWTYADNCEVLDPDQYLPDDAEIQRRAEQFRGRYCAPMNYASALSGMVVM